MPRLQTPVLEIEYKEHGNPSGTPILMLHGFPDSLHTWKPAIQSLTADKTATPRIITPHLRGFGATRILDQEARTGQSAALAQDALDLLDALASSLRARLWPAVARRPSTERP